MPPITVSSNMDNVESTFRLTLLTEGFTILTPETNSVRHANIVETQMPMVCLLYVTPV